MAMATAIGYGGCVKTQSMRAALGFAACQSKKGNSLIIRLLPLQGVGLVWRIFTQGVLALASGKAERPWAMCFCPFGASYS